MLFARTILTTDTIFTSGGNITQKLTKNLTDSLQKYITKNQFLSRYKMNVNLSDCLIGCQFSQLEAKSLQKYLRIYSCKKKYIINHKFLSRNKMNMQ